MNDFVITTKENRHQHVIFPKIPRTSEDRGHFHKLAPSPDGKGVMILPAEDGHIHMIESPIPRKEKKEQKTEEEKAKEVTTLFKMAKENEDEARKIAEESEKFYRGEQWSQEDEQELKSSRRACLTINEIEPKIDILSGYQRQNRQDIRYLPVEDGDSTVSDLLNVIVKVIMDQNDFEYEETETFEDVLIPGRGFFHVYIDRDENIMGDVKIENYPWRNVYLGPFSKKDFSDLEFLVKSKWYSKNKLKAMYPKKADKIERVFSDIYEEDDDGGEFHHTVSGDQYDNSVGTRVAEDGYDPELIDKFKQEFRLLECWRREWESVPVAANMKAGAFVSLRGVNEKFISSVKTLPGFEVVYKRISKMRRTTVAGEVLLIDDYPSEYNDFTIIPVFAKARGKFWWGKVHTAKDPQREVNKRHSQIVDIMNRVAAYGWFWDDETFPDQQEVAKWRRNSSTPGFNQKVSNSERPPVQAEGVKFPNEIANLQAMSTEKLREVLNLNPDMLGLNSRAESGVAIAEKKRQGLLGNEFLFDNLGRAKKKLGKLLVHMIQKCYSPERLMRIVMSQAKTQQVEAGGQKVDPNDQRKMMALTELLRTTDLTKFDVAVTESAFSPTTRRFNFIMWSELAAKGIPVPPQLLVELSDLDDKQKVIGMIQQMQQQAAEAEKAKADAEVQKAQIAAASKMQGK